MSSVWSGVRLLAELLPSGAGKDLTAKTAKALLATVRPRDVAGRTRSALAVELVADVTVPTPRSPQSTHSSPTWSPPPGPA